MTQQTIGVGTVAGDGTGDTLRAGFVKCNDNFTEVYALANAAAPAASPALTGTPTAPTATSGTNTTQLATTAFVKTAVDNLVAGAPGALDTLNEIAAQLSTDESAVTALTAVVATKVTNTRTVNGHALSSDVTIVIGDITGAAPLASPTFTGTVTIPTPTTGDNSTKAASTAFVQTTSKFSLATSCLNLL